MASSTKTYQGIRDALRNIARIVNAVQCRSYLSGHNDCREFRFSAVLYVKISHNFTSHVMSLSCHCHDLKGHKGLGSLRITQIRTFWSERPVSLIFSTYIIPNRFYERIENLRYPPFKQGTMCLSRVV